MKKVFMSIQGSGWCYLSTGGDIKTIANHAVRTDIALLIDAWEHAWSLQYKWNKEAYFDSIWRIIDWDVINDRL
jgi:Fe-Mn family superoxide dismutase